jgi:MHS family citrate/tricarballylate:H+ symporter-like MFS transporter
VSSIDATLQTGYLPLRKVAAVGIGNALEFYDFLTYSFFSIQIGHTFFPVEHFSNSLLSSLATFGIGFVTRPLGGFVIGRYGDRAGRKPAMLLSFSLMGFAITGLALTPSYAQIGMAGPILLVLFRLLQGFALGGEVGPSTAYLIEAAPPDRRGIYVALQFATQDVAVLAAGLIGFALSSLLSPDALDDWGWRAAFLIGVAVVPVGLMIRRRLPETHEASDGPSGEAVPLRLVGLGLALLASGTIGSYVIDYMTTYGQDSLHIPTNLAFGATIATGLFSICFGPIAGILSDRFGRRPVSLIAGVILLLVVMPAFVMVTELRSALALYGLAAGLSMVHAFYANPVLIALAEGLPKSMRSGALALLYAVSIAIFGGSAQFVVRWLIGVTGSPLAPGWYMTGALVIGVAARVLLHETAPPAAGRSRWTRPISR